MAAGLAFGWPLNTAPFELICGADFATRSYSRLAAPEDRRRALRRSLLSAIARAARNCPEQGTRLPPRRQDGAKRYRPAWLHLCPLASLASLEVATSFKRPLSAAARDWGQCRAHSAQCRMQRVANAKSAEWRAARRPAGSRECKVEPPPWPGSIMTTGPSWRDLSPSDVCRALVWFPRQRLTELYIIQTRSRAALMMFGPSLAGRRDATWHPTRPGPSPERQFRPAGSKLAPNRRTRGCPWRIVCPQQLPVAVRGLSGAQWTLEGPKLRHRCRLAAMRCLQHHGQHTAACR